MRLIEGVDYATDLATLDVDESYVWVDEARDQATGVTRYWAAAEEGELAAYCAFDTREDLIAVWWSLGRYLIDANPVRVTVRRLLIEAKEDPLIAGIGLYDGDGLLRGGWWL